MGHYPQQSSWKEELDKVVVSAPHYLPFILSPWLRQSVSMKKYKALKLDIKII